jgi:hypothetical protein
MKTKNIEIRKAEPNDLVQVYELIKELAAFENEPNEPTNSLKKFIEEGTAKNPRFQVLVAETDNRYRRYSAVLLRLFFLERLHVVFR